MGSIPCNAREIGKWLDTCFSFEVILGIQFFKKSPGILMSIPKSTSWISDLIQSIPTCIPVQLYREVKSHVSCTWVYVTTSVYKQKGKSTKVLIHNVSKSTLLAMYMWTSVTPVSPLMVKPTLLQNSDTLLCCNKPKMDI